PFMDGNARVGGVFLESMLRKHLGFQLPEFTPEQEVEYLAAVVEGAEFKTDFSMTEFLRRHLPGLLELVEKSKIDGLIGPREESRELVHEKVRQQDMGDGIMPKLKL